jgi:hypothetical protein
LSTVTEGAGSRGEALRYQPRVLKLQEATAGVSGSRGCPKSLLFSLHSLLHTRVHKILCILTSVTMPQRDLRHVALYGLENSLRARMYVFPW